MKTADQKLKLLYQGSVKRVYQSPLDSDKLWFEFSDDYSVFDWGKMPDTIANKGRALTIMGAYFFEKLADPRVWHKLKQDAAKMGLSTEDSVWDEGMPTHFVRLVDNAGTTVDFKKAASAAGPVYMEVAAAQVLHPQFDKEKGVYKYPPSPQSIGLRLVPLEVVFRYGMPAGSSLKKRLETNPAYAQELGLVSMPKDGDKFERPIIEWFTKLEPKDRWLSPSEALEMSAFDRVTFDTLQRLAVACSYVLQKLFAQRNIELWDGKFEFVTLANQIMLADSIGPDELRLIHQDVHLSKEMIRQIYRDTPWELAIREAQKTAATRNSTDWKSICRDELKQEPVVLPAKFKKKIDQLYGVLVNHLTGEQLFGDQPNLESFVKSIKEEA